MDSLVSLFRLKVFSMEKQFIYPIVYSFALQYYLSNVTISTATMQYLRLK